MLGATLFQTLRRFYGTDAIAFSSVSDEFNPIKDGQLVLAQINGHHIVGRRFQLDGHSWLIQPSRWIRITNPAGVHLLSVVG